MTAHWIDEKTLARKHAVLACSRLTGSHTYEMLADAMTTVHSKFGLQDKVRRTTTDNASNFIKAFVQFSSKPDLLPTVAEDLDAERDPSDAALLEEPALGQFVEETVRDVVVPVEDILEQADSDDVHLLPTHMRCAAHTFNLVATTDADKALLDDVFEGASTSAVKKARQLWNAQSRSTLSADIIKEELNKRLRVPNVTRWNSMYDAVLDLNSYLDEPSSRLVFKLLQSQYLEQSNIK